MGREHARGRFGPRAWRRIAAAGLALALLGCSSLRQVPPRSVSAEGLGGARLVLKDGYTYGFDRVYARGDSLVGVYSVVEERIGADGSVAYVDVARETVLPASSVDRVEVRRLDVSKSVLLGAGAVISGIWLAGILGSGDDEGEDGGKSNPID